MIQFRPNVDLFDSLHGLKQEPIVVKIDTSHMHEPSEGEEVGSWLLSCKLEPNYPMIRLGPHVQQGYDL